MRRRVLVGVAALFLAIACYVAWPLLTLVHIKHAVEHGDTATLKRSVDWSAVKESLTTTLIAEIAAAPSGPEAESMGYMSRLGHRIRAMVAPGMIRTAVSRYATPEGIVELAAQRRDWARRMGNPLPETFIEKMKDVLSRSRGIRFASLTRFEAEMDARGNPQRRITAVAVLRSWRWMLVEVHVRSVDMRGVEQGGNARKPAAK